MQKLDCRGVMCPIPIVQLSRAVKSLNAGETVEIVGDDAIFEADVRAWCGATGHRLRSLTRDEGAVTAVIEKS